MFEPTVSAALISPTERKPMIEAPQDAVSDDLILAAIKRAERHSDRRGATMSLIRDHLGLPQRSGAGRKVRVRVLALADAGVLEHLRRHGRDLWTLTPAAKRRLRRAEGVADELPESPQHQRWARAHRLAEQEVGRFETSLRASLEEATASLDADMPAPSDTWFALSRRLEHRARRLGSAIHCLHEWPEPSDDVPDLDEGEPHGRRNTALWNLLEEKHEALLSENPRAKPRRRE
jgi:hypothetical protein